MASTPRGGTVTFRSRSRKHLKITASKGGFYYHVNVRLFPKNTEVPTFTKECLASTALAAARAILRKDPLIEDFPSRSSSSATAARSIRARRWSSRSRARGPALLAGGAEGGGSPHGAPLRADPNVRGRRGAPVGRRAARRLLRDIPDFTQYATYPAGVRSDGNGYFRLPVPFARSLKILVTNEGKEGLELALGGAIEKTKNPRLSASMPSIGRRSR